MKILGYIKWLVFLLLILVVFIGALKSRINPSYSNLLSEEREIRLSLASLNGAFKGENAHEDEIPTTLVFPPFKHTLGFHRASPIHLKIFLKGRTSFADPQGITAVKSTDRDNPNKSGDDDELTVYGVNSGKGEIIYNKSMISADIYGKTGSRSGEFKNPHGIAAEPGGNVYVADSGNNRIVHLFDKKGEIKFLGVFGDSQMEKCLQEPMCVALDQKKNVYVTDSGNNRIAVFDSEGKFIKEITGFESPFSITIVDSEEQWIRYRESCIYLTDRSGKRLMKLDENGTILKEITPEMMQNPGAGFNYLAADYYTNIYAVDTAGNCIHKFDRNLNYITTFGKYGSGDREFISPRGITIWKRFGQIFVAEKEGAQYYWIGVDILDLKIIPEPLSKGFIIEFKISEPAIININIKTQKNDLVWDGIKDLKCFELINRIKWNGSSNTGAEIQKGTYILELAAQATYSSKKYFNKTKRIEFSVNP